MARQTIVLDLTTELGVPVAAAVSTDGSGGALAIGLGCRGTFDAAARAAVMELCQMEIGLMIAIEKAGGGASLSGSDEGHLARAALTVDMLPLSSERSPTAIVVNGLHELVARLDLDVALVEHRPDDGAIAVLQAVALDLQPMPATIVTPRLARHWAGHAAGRLPPLMA
jgi:ribosomal protein S12 methylthiotransferase accessory factor